MTNPASIDYADVVEQLAERHWNRTSHLSGASGTPWAALDPYAKDTIRAFVEPVLADLLDLHGNQWQERSLCDPAPTIWATVTLRMDRGAQPAPGADRRNE